MIFFKNFPLPICRPYKNYFTASRSIFFFFPPSVCTYISFSRFASFSFSFFSYCHFYSLVFLSCLFMSLTSFYSFHVHNQVYGVNPRFSLHVKSFKKIDGRWRQARNGENVFCGVKSGKEKSIFCELIIYRE